MWNVLKFIGGLLIAIAAIIFAFFGVLGALGIAAISILGVLVFVVIILLCVPFIALFVKLTGKGTVSYSVGKTTYSYGKSERPEVIDVEIEDTKKDI